MYNIHFNNAIIIHLLSFTLLHAIHVLFKWFVLPLVELSLGRVHAKLASLTPLCFLQLHVLKSKRKKKDSSCLSLPHPIRRINIVGLIHNNVSEIS
jgi:hypothetical protein